MRSGDEATIDMGFSSAASAPSQQSGRIRFTSNIVGPIYLFADILCLLITAPLAVASYQILVGERVVPSVHLFAFAVVSASYLFLRASRGSYRRTLANLLSDESEAGFDAVISTLLAAALVWQFGLIEHYSRGISLLFLLFFVVTITCSRPLVRGQIARLAKKGRIEQRVAFYGADPRSVRLIGRLLSKLNLPHLRIIGLADDRPRARDLQGLPFLGGLEELTQMARNSELDQILISVPDLPAERVDAIIEKLSNVAVDVSLIPAEAIRLPGYRVRLLGTVPVLTLWQRPFRDINQFVKRAEDLVLAAFALLFTAPLLAMCAILIRLSSSGPILFVQPRIGFNNEVIQVFKFRTMYFDQTDLGARATTTRHDPRVTPVGRVLRRLSLDELPQLFNVLKGEMSLVGPRPHALEMKVGDRHYQEAVRGYAGRHRVRPGITGLAQVRGLRGEIRTIERATRRVELDKEYIDRWSIWLDIWILIMTARAVLFDRDAY